jgi:hypothetical protein
MKMDATQKRRMWKVIGCHFFFTIYVLFLLIKSSHYKVVNPSDPTQWINIFGAQLLIFLQPVAYLIAGYEHELLALALTPLWSFCFGWLYVKFTNWLNHFPVLGKKVF